MNQCKTCKWWEKHDDNEIDQFCNPEDPVTYEWHRTEEETLKRFGYIVRKCQNPKIFFYERPEINAASVIDGSGYLAKLITAEQFGCSLWEKLDA